MKVNTLRERISEYEKIYDYRFIRKLPIITVINGRSFKKTTSLLKKPFSEDFLKLMCYTMIRLLAEVDGAVFAYCYSDEITLVSRNDQTHETEPWYNGSIQKISSATSSIASTSFLMSALENDINLIGDPIFTSSSFVVPNTMEVVNTLINKQQSAFNYSVHSACYFELLKKYTYDTVDDTLKNLTSEEKIDLLFQETGIEFNSYSSSFRKGAACYRAPKLIDHQDGSQEIKNKITIDADLPTFSKNIDFLSEIITGKNILKL